MDNLKLMKPSDLDKYQMDNRTFDDKKDAWRVSVVDGLTMNVDKINLPEMKFPEQQVIKVPEIIKETEIHQINVPVIVKEVQIERVEVPVIVREVETVTIEKPVYIHEIKVVEIEKPVIVKETEFKVIEKNILITPIIVKVCMVVQALAVIGLLITNILKG